MKIKSYELKTKSGKMVSYSRGKFCVTESPAMILAYHAGWSRGDQAAILKDAEKQIGEPCEWLKAEHDLIA